MRKALFILFFAQLVFAQVRIPGPGGAGVTVPTPTFFHSFNNNSGAGSTATADLGDNCTLSNHTWVEDPASSGHHAIDFGGVNTNTNCGTALDSLNDFTVSVWVQADTYGSGGGTGALIVKGGNTVQLRSWMLRLGDTSDNIVFLVGDNTAGTQLYDTFISDTDSFDPYMGTSTWVHITVVLTGCTAMACSGQIYIDGSAVTTTQSANNTGTRRSDTADTVSIGSLTTIGNYADARIDHVKVWNSSLSAAQVAADHALGRP